MFYTSPDKELIYLEIRFREDTVSCLEPVLYQDREHEVTQELRLPDSMPDAGRVICGWAQPVIRSKEWRSESVYASGGMTVWVLYSTEDGSQSRWVDAWVPFQMKWDIPSGETDGVLRLMCSPTPVDARLVSERKLMLRCPVRIMAEALVPVQEKLSLPQELPEDVHVLKQSYPVTLLREAGEQQFQLDEELSLPSGSPDAQKIISYTLWPGITEQKISEDKLIYRGNIRLELVYLGEDEKFHSAVISVPFSQLAQLDASYSPESGADVVLTPASHELELTEEGMLRLKCDLIGQYLVQQRQLVEVIEDAYSYQRPVNMTAEEVRLPVVLDRYREVVHLDEKVNQPCERIVQTCLYPGPCQRTDDGDGMDLTGLAQVLYYDDTSALKSANLRWREKIPSDADQNCKIFSMPDAADRVRTQTDGSQITLSGELELKLTAMCSQRFPSVTGLELGQASDEQVRRPSLILKRRGKLSLWEIAKGCGSTVEDILGANPDKAQNDEAGFLLIPVR